MLTRVLSRQRLVVGRTVVRWQQSRRPSLWIPSTLSSSSSRCQLHPPPSAAVSLSTAANDASAAGESTTLQNEATSTSTLSSASETTTLSDEASQNQLNEQVPEQKGLGRDFASGPSPKEELHNWYQKNKPKHAITNSAFAKEMLTSKEDGKKWWTASFTCPDTGETYAAGTVETELPRLVAHNKVYYSRSKVAERAAAAHAIDMIQYREEEITNPRLCLEDPASTLLSDHHDDDDLSSAKVPEPKKGMGREFGSGSPKEELHNWYYRNYPNHYGSFVKEKMKSSNGQTWWTATFICPATGETYAAGTLEKQLPRLVAHNKVYYEKSKFAERAASARAIDMIQYREKKITVPRLCLEDPASSSSQHDENGHNATAVMGMQRLEDPAFSSSHDDAVLEISQEEDSLSGENTHNVVLAGVTHYNEEDENLSVLQEDDVVVTPSAIMGLTEYPLADIDDDNDDDYTIQRLSNISDDASMTQGGKTTLERVMDAWAEGLTPDAVSRSPSTSHNSALPLPYWNPSQQRKLAMADALEWYKNMQLSLSSHGNGTSFDTKRRWKNRGKTKFQTTALPFSVAAGNVILTALANANQSIPLQQTYEEDDLAESKEIESLAKQIVDLLWQQSLEKQQPPPNADTYIAYLRCLAGPTPQTVAKRAGNLLQGMMEGIAVEDGVVLPKPTTGTFNTVIQLWSRVGGQLGRDEVNRVYNLLLDPGHNTKPNRETFLSILASMANGSSNDDDVDGCPTYFEPDQARRWIAQMENYRDILQDETLQPDVQVYNAPLRWSSDSINPRCSYSRSIPWDRHDTVFENGFKDDSSSQQKEDDDDELTKEALRMEEWLGDMEQHDKTTAPPDIETYESVIQAWTRTGTLDGLLQAESLALRVITASCPPNDGIVRPRLRTFHPILAAWVHSGDKRGPKKVQEWINRLELLCTSSGVPEVKPDGRVRASLIRAWRMCLKRLIEEEEASNEVESEETDASPEEQETASYLDLSPSNDDESITMTPSEPKETDASPEEEETANYLDLTPTNDESITMTPLESKETDASPEEEETANYLDLSPSNDNESITMTPLEAAQKCAETLEGLCDELRQVRLTKEEPEFLLEGAAFTEVVEAWGELALSMKTSNPVGEGQAGSFTRNNSVAHVLQTVKLLLDTIQFYVDYECNQKKDEFTGEDPLRGELDGTSLDRGGHSRQLRHLMYSAPKVYSTAVSILNDLDQVDAETRRIDLFQRMGAGENFFTRYLPRIEVMLRRSEEYRVLLNPPHQQVDFSPASNTNGESNTDLGVADQQYVDKFLVYNDLYSYNPALSSDTTTETASANSQLELYLQIVAGCKNITASHDVGDAIRLCMLILEGVRHISPAESTHDGIDVTKLYSAIISVVGSKVSNTRERAALLNRLGESVTLFEDMKGPRHALAWKPVWADRTAVLSEIESVEHAMKTKVVEQRLDHDTSSRTTARSSRRRVRLKKRHKKSSC